MKISTVCIHLLFLVTFMFNACSQDKDFPVIKGPYLGQKPPGMIAELFAPGIFSTDANEFNAVFTPEGDAIYFTSNGKHGQDIMVIERKHGIWQQRKPAPFSDSFRDVDPFITYDGNKLFFSSNRPIEGNESRKDCDFWYVEKLQSGKWSKAKHLDNPCTPGKHDFYYVSSLDGAIYYSIFDDDKGDLYFISPEPSDQTPYPLQSPINTEYNEHDPYITPDGRYLIFTSNRPGGYGSADLYLCFKKADGIWSDPINMGETINSEQYDYCPILSPDQKYFFFSSSRSGNGDVYWVDAKILDEIISNLE